MRDILFRGKRTDNGEWVYGFYWKDIWGDGESCYILYDCENYPVTPSTVGRYTGLTDKNGVKIFEGDICDFSTFDYNDCDTQHRGVVVYAGSRFMLWKTAESECYGADGGFDLDWVVEQDDEFEVIGNIYDNPGLLEGGDEG